jgi:hypothetical protein
MASMKSKYARPENFMVHHTRYNEKSNGQRLSSRELTTITQLIEQVVETGRKRRCEFHPFVCCRMMKSEPERVQA